MFESSGPLMTRDNTPATIPPSVAETPTVEALRNVLYDDQYEQFAATCDKIGQHPPRFGLTEAQNSHAVTVDFIESCRNLGDVRDLAQTPELFRVYEAYSRQAPESLSLVSGHLALVTGAILHGSENKHSSPAMVSAQQEMLRRLNEDGYLGVLALTEGRHGTDASNIETTATRDPETGEWILHTPRFEARKFMPNVGDPDTPKVMVVAAQLYATDESGKQQHQGVSLFMVPVHAPDSPAGVAVERMGDKTELAMDNAETTFTSVRLPHEYWLPGQYAYIDEQGVYQNPLTSHGKRYHDAITSIGSGRVGLTVGAVTATHVALAFAYNYASQRETIGGKKIIECDNIQEKLIESAVDILAMTSLMNEVKRRYSDPETPATLRAALAMQSKAYVTGRARQVIDSLGDTLGAHGIFKANILPILAGNTKGSHTAEGDGDVMSVTGGRLAMRMGAEDALAAVSYPAPALEEGPAKWFDMVDRHALALIAEGVTNTDKMTSEVHAKAISRAAVGSLAMHQLLDAADATTGETKKIIGAAAEIYALHEIRRAACWHAKEQASTVAQADEALAERYKQLWPHIPQLVKALAVPQNLLSAPVASEDYTQISLAESARRTTPLIVAQQ